MVRADHIPLKVLSLRANFTEYSFIKPVHTSVCTGIYYSYRL
jgi:hypothetical protein